MKKNIVICTVSSNNYLPYGVVCLQSASFFNDKCDLIYLIADEFKPCVYEKYKKITFIDVRNIGIAEKDLNEMSFKYNITEFNTCIKPAFFKFLLTKYKKVVYLDPDTQTYSNYNEIIKDLDRSDIILTPHKLTTKTSKIIEDSEFLNNGIYNLGFIGLKSSKNTISFLDWWEKKLKNECYINYKKGLATDQIWVNFVPIFFNKVKIAKDEGLNVAFWNINERCIKKYKNSRFIVNNNYILKFVHFSSMGINCDKQKLENIFNNSKELRNIYIDHINDVKKYSFYDIERTEYAFLRFKNGVKIPNYIRYIYGNSNKLKLIYPDPFSDKKDSLYYFVFKKHALLKLNKNDTNIQKITKLLINIFGLNNVARAYYKLSKLNLEYIAEII